MFEEWAVDRMWRLEEAAQVARVKCVTPHQTLPAVSQQNKEQGSQN